jgi:hypothetical protein
LTNSNLFHPVFLGELPGMKIESSGIWAQAFSRTKSYRLATAATNFRAGTLDSSDYAGEIIYRTSCQVGPDDGASAQRRPASAPLGLSKSHISASLRGRPASIEFYRGASLLRVRIEGDRQQQKPPKRGEITRFSDSSRRRMLDFMAKIDSALVPLFVTLTYPDHFPIYHETFKTHLDLLGQRIRRRWPEAFIIWKLEFKVRQSGENKGKLAPHYHLFVYGVPMEFPFKKEVGKFFSLKPRAHRFKANVQVWEERVLEKFHDGHAVEIEDPQQPRDNLKRWMSRNWFEIVGSDDLRHFKAGTRVEELRSTKGAFYYASKSYMGKSEDCPQSDAKPGRYWGVIGRSKVRLGKREVLEITAEQAITMQRTIRRYRRANTDPKKRRFLRGHRLSAKLYCDVDYWIERLNLTARPGCFQESWNQEALKPPASPRSPA